MKRRTFLQLCGLSAAATVAPALAKIVVEKPVSFEDGTRIPTIETECSDLFHDQYEKGTWIPSVNGNTGVGYYTRIGDVIQLTGQIDTPKNRFLIKGLPFIDNNATIVKSDNVAIRTIINNKKWFLYNYRIKD